MDNPAADLRIIATITGWRIWSLQNRQLENGHGWPTGAVAPIKVVHSFERSDGAFKATSSPFDRRPSV